MRVCKKCEIEKVLEDFPVYNQEKGWHRWECRTCLNSRVQRQLKSDPDTRNRQRDSKRKSSERLWQDTLDAYGRCCSCCGETETDFLEIDHINNDGAKHRATMRPQAPKSWAGKAMYSWLRQNKFPADFQLLCSNCNKAKSRARGCPHKRNILSLS